MATTPAQGPWPGAVRPEQAGLPYEAHLHRARLQDLQDMAARHGIDVSPWIDYSMRPREVMAD